MKKRVLFVCIHNSARSQMAEAFLDRMCGHDFEVHSAGLEPGRLNPLVVESMHEVGIDISCNLTKAAVDYLRAGMRFAYVITVCDEASAERCPFFPGLARQMNWSFPDPSVLQGPREEQLRHVRKIRDAIKAKVEAWCDEICPTTKCCC